MTSSLLSWTTNTSKMGLTLKRKMRELIMTENGSKNENEFLALKLNQITFKIRPIPIQDSSPGISLPIT